MRISQWLCLAVLLTCGAPAAEFFIAPNGNDAHPGTQAKPFATLERARDQIRASRAAGETKGSSTVYLRGGNYFRTNAFELTAADAATPKNPLVFRAYKSERPRLLGGRSLTGFSPVTDPAVLARLAPGARLHVVQLDLHSLGLSDFGAIRSRGFSRPQTPAHSELFFNGKPMTLARWPNQGAWETLAGFPQGSARGDEHGGRLGSLASGFFYHGDRPAGWKDTGDLWVHGYWAWDWANSYEQVAALDTTQRLVKTASPFGLYGFRKGQRFYFLNLLEELDTPEEYFLDRKTGVLYFWPPAAPAQAEIVLSLMSDPLLRLKDASHLAFRGLVLEATRGNAVEINGGATNLIAECLLRDIGDCGIRIQGGSGHTVAGCDIFDTGDGGVSLQGGDRSTLTPAGHVVDNCHFARQGRWSKCYVPAILLGGVGMRARHNLIHDHPHCAILYNGNDHLVEFNEIHHVALETGDVGAIYAGRDYTFRGSRIRHNYIHETGGVGMGSMGVYMDDCVSGTEIYGNLFYRVQRAAFIGGGRDHRVVNNIFVECDPAVQVDGRGLDRSPVWRNMVDKTMRQRLGDVPLELYRERYPALKTLDRWLGAPPGPPLTGDAFRGVPPEGNVIERNVCAGKWLRVGWNATLAMLRIDNNLTNAAPGDFRAKAGKPPSATDFELSDASAAWELGFETIPLKQIGLRPGPRPSH